MLTQRIKEHIKTQYLAGSGDDLDDETPLFELNIVDSAAIFDLVQFLSAEASVRIPIEHVVADNFRSIGAMARLVESLRPPRAA